MKLAIVVLLISMSAFAGSKKKVVNVTGTRAQSLMNIASKLDIVDSAMGGNKWFSMSGISCTKTVNKDTGRVACEIEKTNVDGKGLLKISTDDGSAKGGAANELRVQLNELTNAESKVSAFEKRIQIKSVECEGRKINQDLTDLDIEAKYSCVITVK